MSYCIKHDLHIWISHMLCFGGKGWCTMGVLGFPSLTARGASRALLGSGGLNKTCFVAESDCFHCNIDLIEAGDVIYCKKFEWGLCCEMKTRHRTALRWDGDALMWFDETKKWWSGVSCESRKPQWLQASVCLQGPQSLCNLTRTMAWRKQWWISTLLLALFQNLESCLVAYCLHRHLASKT